MWIVYTLQVKNDDIDLNVKATYFTILGWLNKGVLEKIWGN